MAAELHGGHPAVTTDDHAASSADAAAMSTKFDIGDLEHELAALASRPHLSRIAIVVPIAPGMRELASAAIAEGPPFDPTTVGVESHQVLLSDREAIFIFGLEGGPEILERVLASDDFWATVQFWERIADGRPKLADVVYEWHANP